MTIENLEAEVLALPKDSQAALLSRLLEHLWRGEIDREVGSIGGEDAQIRDLIINIRMNQPQSDLIDRAAQIQGKSPSEFMVDSAYQKAQDVLLDRCFFGLDEVKFKEFVALLDAQPMENEKLQTLLTTQSPWD
ncbi:DUF1778 domain-containing protein [Microcoleus sp. EPA2]|uniref:type II toxin-antitoxin system TacA family antitoxin n=1 Tax=Microcoleus sp. EPA2 TaxID=2841654 RepID=UPI00312B59E8